MSRTTTTVAFDKTDGPGYLRHFEIVRDGDTVFIQSVNSRGFCQVEAAVPATDFFAAVEKLR